MKGFPVFMLVVILICAGLTISYLYRHMNLKPGGAEWTATVNNASNGADIHAVRINNAGDIYVGGSFSDSTGFEKDGRTINKGGIPGVYNSFIGEYNSDGSCVNLTFLGDESTTFELNGMCPDTEGNVIARGFFKGEFSFGSGPDANRVESGGENDYAAVKIDTTGTVLWAYALGDYKNNYFMDLAVTPENDVLIAGRFQDSIDFDPSSAHDQRRSSNGGMDCFLVELNPQGELKRVWTWGGFFEDGATGVDCDSNGNIYVSGNFSDKVDLDPGPGVDERSAITKKDGDGFLIKIGPDGSFQWCATLAWAKFIDFREIYVVTSESGDSYVSGNYYNDEFQTPTLGGGMDLFLEKIGPDGKVVFQKNWGGPQIDLFSSLSFDEGSNHVFVSGFFLDEVDFDTGPGSVIRGTSMEQRGMRKQDSFVSEFDENGEFVDVGIFDYPMMVKGMSADNSGNVYLGIVYPDGASTLAKYRNFSK